MYFPLCVSQFMESRVKMINSLSLTDDFVKMINLLNKTDDFVKRYKNCWYKWKGVKSEKLKYVLCVFLNLWSQERVRTWRKSEFWSNLARFGSRNGILTKWHNDSASFLLEKLKNQVILIKNFNIWPKIPKIPQKSRKIFLHNIDQGGMLWNSRFSPSRRIVAYTSDVHLVNGFLSS